MDSEVNMQNVSKNAKCEMEAVVTDAPQLTAMAVATDSCHRLLKRSLE